MKMVAMAALVAALVAQTSFARVPEPENQTNTGPCRYSLPEGLLDKPFHFAGDLIPIQRSDVRYRLTCHLNFLLLDARSILTEWLSEKSRYSWLFEEVFAKEGIPREFILLAPILSVLNSKASLRVSGTGWWFLSRPCASTEGIDMADDSWHDDRLDLELSTRCFAVRIKDTRKELGGDGWLMPMIAYLTSVRTVQELRERWKSDAFWDLPLPDAAEEVVLRWIALGIIDSHRGIYGLRFKDAAPMTFDQITGLVLAKDLTLADIARMTSVPPREILRLNPKIKAGVGAFPSKSGGKLQTHTVSAPRGAGNALLEALKKEGYLAPP